MNTRVTQSRGTEKHVTRRESTEPGEEQQIIKGGYQYLGLEEQKRENENRREGQRGKQSEKGPPQGVASS